MQREDTLPDYLRPGLDIVSIGLNPSLPSVRLGYYFANPRNRFWRALNASGLVPVALEPGVEAMELMLRHYGIGFTDVVKRPTAGGGKVVPVRRPLWMLPEPEPLTVREGYPWHEGRLCLLSGPERLETGWWDADGISRDYYEAYNPRGRRLWVFRVRQRQHADAGHWYLHGYFG